MAGQKLRRFTRPEVLRQIRPDRLLRLLNQFAGDFVRLGFPLPEDPEQLDIEGLAKILADAAKQAPSDLINSLYLVDQLATRTGEDAVRRVLEKFGPTPLSGEQMSHADAAVEAWLIDPQALVRAQAAQISVRSRSLRLYAVTEHAILESNAASSEFIAALKGHLATSFDRIGLGAPMGIFAFPHSSGVRYVIQRGGPFARYGVNDRGKPSTIGFEPLEFDIVAYDAVHRELEVKDMPIREREALRTAFGLALAGDAEAFSTPLVVNLDPIKRRGRDAMWCNDVPGLSHVVLKGISVRAQPALKYFKEEKASDLFAAWEKLRSGPPQWGQIQRVDLEFHFRDSTQPRSATVRDGACLKLTRDDDSELIQAFLRRRQMLGDRAVIESNEGPCWDWLDRPDGWTAANIEWQHRLRHESDVFARYVSATGQIASCLRFDGERWDRTVRVVEPDEYLAICEVTGKIDRVSPEMVALLAFDVDELVKSVSKAMSLQGTAGRSGGQQWTWWVGEYSPVEGQKYPVYFVAAPDPVSFHAECLTIAGHCKQPFVIVTPTRHHAIAENRGKPGMPTVEWVSLSECARLDGDGSVVLSRPLDVILKPFLQVHLPQLHGSPLRPLFPTPTEATWREVFLQFKDPYTVFIRVGGTSRTYTYAEMGMADGRTPRPNEQWELLRRCAFGRGELTWDGVSPSRHDQKRLERLNQGLRSFFGIEPKPFKYIRKLKGWKAQFTTEHE